MVHHLCNCDGTNVDIAWVTHDINLFQHFLNLSQYRAFGFR